ncbi:MAG: TraB/VirB10 family protein [Emcibacter sp.]|nr:TraB/VirB10 family protein [Emcibacter sp.]
MDSNNKTLTRQWLLGFGGVAASLGIIGIFIILSNSDNSAKNRADNLKQRMDLEGLVSKPTLRDDWLSRNELRLEEMEQRLGKLADIEARNVALQKKLGHAGQEKKALIKDAKRTLDVYEKRITDLERKGIIQKLPSGKNVMRPVKKQSPRFFGPAVGRVGPNITASVMPARSIEILRFENDGQGADNILPEVYDVRNYLPPNAYVKAKVLVGVDATVGAKAQNDPKPVAFRIIGPAYSASQNGNRLETDVEGCVVNGAAFGELSSEKVFVKLQKMTCPDGPNRVAITGVEGYLAFQGKAGIRGRVVSREGDLVTQALLAGIAGGFGRGFSANANSRFRTVGIGSTDNQLSAGQILTGGLGQGVATAAETVSEYLIDRAEQYQPVIEMPTGVEVELVFINGAMIRRTGS